MKALKWTGGIIGGLVVIFIIIGIIAVATSEPEVSTPAPTPTPASAPSPAPTPEPANIPPPAAPAPVPEVKPSPSPAPEPEPETQEMVEPEKAEPGIGDIVDIGNGALMVVEEFTRQEDLGFITVFFDNSNGIVDITVSSWILFEVKDDDGNMAELDIFTERQHPAPDGTVLTGDKLRGTLVYNLMGLSESLKLYYLPDIMSRPIKILLK